MQFDSKLISLAAAALELQDRFGDDVHPVQIALGEQAAAGVGRQLPRDPR